MNPSAKTVNVLIVDDNPLVRELMAQALDPVCRVIIASDGADALLRAVDAPPDLIITDFKMPATSSLTALMTQRLKPST